MSLAGHDMPGLAALQIAQSDLAPELRAQFDHSAMRNE